MDGNWEGTSNSGNPPAEVMSYHVKLTDKLKAIMKLLKNMKQIFCSKCPVSASDQVFDPDVRPLVNA